MNVQVQRFKDSGCLLVPPGGALALLLVALLSGCGDPAGDPAPVPARQSLFHDLAGFEAGAGIPNQSPRFLSLHQDPHRAEEHPALRLFGPPSGSIRGPHVEVAEGARLELGVGLEVVDPVAENPEALTTILDREPARTRFEIRWIPGTETGAARSLGEVTVELGPTASRTRTRQEITLDLRALASGSGRFEFVTERLDPSRDLSILPTWWSPTLVHPTGPPSSRPRSDATRVLCDLLEQAPSAEWQDAEASRSWQEAGRDCFLEAHFSTGAGLHVPRGGSRPALSFRGSGTVWFTLDPVPEADQAELRFETGFQTPAEPVPGLGAQLTVLVDGEERHRFEVLQDETPTTWGWSETRRVPIPELAGADHPLRLGLRVQLSSPPAGGATPVCLGLGRPRIVESRLPRTRKSSPRAPNVLFLCVETWRADDVSWRPAPGIVTPELARWASRGRVFTRAYSPSCWTLPSSASYLTGLDPWAHGAVSEVREILKDQTETLAEAARWEGARTMAFVTNALLREETGFAAGFETHVTANTASAAQVNQAFLDWLSAHPADRFFAYLHYFDPHAPMSAPGRFADAFVPADLAGRDHVAMDRKVRLAQRETMNAGREAEALAFLRARYQGEVAFLDHHLGALLQQLEDRGLLENTLVILTSDHGEEFGEHRWSGHGSQVFEETVRVPLAVWGPGVEPGLVDEPVEALQATLAAARVLGLDRWLETRGGDRPPLPLRGDDTTSAAVFYLATEKGIDLTSDPWPVALTDHPERLMPRPLRALVTGDQKAVLRMKQLPPRATAADLAPLVERLELYNLAKDPAEQDPQVVEFHEAPRAVQEHLLRQLQRELEGARALPTTEMAPSTLQVLQELGYIEGG